MMSKFPQWTKLPFPDIINLEWTSEIINYFQYYFLIGILNFTPSKQITMESLIDTLLDNMRHIFGEHRILRKSHIENFYHNLALNFSKLHE